MSDLNQQIETLRTKKQQYLDGAYENINSTIRRQRVCGGELDLILEYYRLPTELDDGLSLEEQISFISDRYDVQTRRVVLKPDWYRGGVLPTLVETEQGYRAVLPSVSGHAYFYENGKRRRITNKNQSAFGENGICFYQGVGEVHTVFGFLKFLSAAVSSGEKLWILLLNLLCLLVGLAIPAVNYVIFHYIIPAASLPDIFPIACILFAVAGMMFVTGLLQSSLLSKAMLKMGIYAQGALFSKLLRLKTEFFQERKSGELSDGIVGFSNAAVSMGTSVFSACISVVLSFVYIVQMCCYIQNLVYAVVGIVAVLAVILVLQTHSMLVWKRKCAKSSASMTGFVYEFFSGMEKIKLNGAELRMFHKWSGKYAAFARTRHKPFLVKYADTITRVFTIAATAALFLAVSAQPVSSAQYIAFYSAYGAFLAILLRIPTVMESAAAFMSTLMLVKPLIEAETETVSFQRVLPKKEDIHLSQLSFRYHEGERDVLNNLNLTIKKGTCVGITGASGCGKSTLLRLLLGFEDHYRGNIFIGSTNFREMDMRSWRKSIGAVLQNSKLMKGTIYSNIILARPQATMDEVMRAVRFAGLTEDIDAMPMGLHTMVSEDNCTVSGGQKQRILIARAIIGEPQLVIFDEATSALDNMLQSVVTENLRRLDCTKLIIAHRLSTLRNCDRILVLSQGVITADGTFDDLIENSPEFAALMKRQTV